MFSKRGMAWHGTGVFCRSQDEEEVEEVLREADGIKLKRRNRRKPGKISVTNIKFIMDVLNGLYKQRTIYR